MRDKRENILPEAASGSIDDHNVNSLIAKPLTFPLTMSDQVFVMFRVFVILNFLSFLKTPMLHIFPIHFEVLFKYEYRVFRKGVLFERQQEFI